MEQKAKEEGLEHNLGFVCICAHISSYIIIYHVSVLDFQDGAEYGSPEYGSLVASCHTATAVFCV